MIYQRIRKEQKKLEHGCGFISGLPNPIANLAIVVHVLMFFFLDSKLLAYDGLRPPEGLRKPRHGNVYVVAHRGVHDSIPENTLAAYQKAIDFGCDFVEIDVRTTLDSQLVSIHDATIDRYSNQGQKGRVSDMTVEQLRSIDIGSRVNSKWRDERVPTVREILQLCRGKIGVYLDVKAAKLDELVSIVREFGMEQDTLWYIPPNKVEELLRLSDHVWPMPDPGPERYLPDLLKLQNPRVVASAWKHFSLEFGKRCHDHGAIVIVDEGDRSSWVPLLEFGADGIQTDHPEELIKFLDKRSQDQK